MKTDHSADEKRAVLEALRRVVQALRVTARDAELRHGVSAAQLFVLHLLARDGSASINELAERTFTHQSSVSVVITRLAAAGLVSRQTSAEDRRRADVVLTARGRALLRRVPEPAQSRLLDALERVSQPERRALARGLAALVREMGVADGVAGMFFEESATRTRGSSRGRATSRTKR